MRVRRVSSLLFLQRFPPLNSVRNGPEDSCSDGIRLSVTKTNRDDSGLLVLPDFQLAPTRIRRFIHFPCDLSLWHHRICRVWFSFLCQGPGSRPTSFTDVRVSGAVGRLSSDQKVRQPSILSRMLLIDWLYIFFDRIYIYGLIFLQKEPAKRDF